MMEKQSESMQFYDIQTRKLTLLNNNIVSFSKFLKSTSGKDL